MSVPIWSWRSVSFAALCAIVLAVAPIAAQDPCEAPEANGTVSLPPPGCEYLTGDEVHMIIDGLPPGTTIELAPIHKDFICREQNPNDPVCGLDDGAGGKNEFFSSNAEFMLTGKEPAGSETCISSLNRKVTIPIFCQTNTGPRGAGSPQSFDTKMMGLQGQITGDPDFDLLRVTAGNSNGLPSPGHTTLTKMPNGNWNVDSFFDITYRIDFVGAPGGCLAGRSGSTTGIIRMVAVGKPIAAGAPVGTGWSAAILVLGLLATGTFFLFQRKAAVQIA